MADGFGPITRNLNILLEGRRQQQQDAQDEERQKILDKRASEDFKLRVRSMNLQAQKLQAEIKQDVVTAEQKLKEIQQKERAGESVDIANFLKGNLPPTSAPGPQGGQTFAGEAGPGFATGEQIAAAKVVQERVREIELGHKEDLVRATNEGAASLRDETRIEKAKVANENQTRKFEFEQEKFRLRTKELRVKEEIDRAENDSLLTDVSKLPERERALVLDDVSKMFKGQMALKEISNTERKDWVQFVMKEKGIVEIDDKKDHFQYRKDAVGISFILKEIDELIALEYGLTVDQLDDKTAILNAQGNPTSGLRRLGGNIAGFIESTFSSTEEAKRWEVLQAKVRVLSEGLGGDRGARLSDQDAIRALNNLPKLGMSLPDMLQRREAIKGGFQGSFDGRYSNLSQEQQQFIINDLSLPFRAGTPLSINITNSAKIKGGSKKISGPQVQEVFTKEEEAKMQEAAGRFPDLSIEQIRSFALEARNANQ